MQKLKKPVSILLSVIMVLSLFTIVPFTANAAEAVEYVYRWWDADAKEVKQETRTCSDYTDIRNRASDDLAPGWYYFDQPTSLTNGERLFVRSGTVNIILKDGKMLEIDEGIGVEPGATLNIFGQAEDSGYLVCGADDPNNAAIGGTIEGENDTNPNAGDINIYGGKVQTGSGYDTCKGAGVGGANEGSPHRIAIYGGEHRFRRIGNGAGIGGGSRGWAADYTDEGVTGEGIRIYGGTVEAYSGTGAGIGNGNHIDGAPCSIAIHGGNVMSMGTAGGAGIGSGRIGSCPYIHIYDGSVTAIGYNPDGESGAGIGSGAESILLGVTDNDINIHGGKVVALGTSGAGIGSGYNRDSGSIRITGGAIFASSTAGGAGIGSGYNGKSGEITIQDAVVLATTAGEEMDENAFESMFNSMLSDAGNMMNQYQIVGPNGPNSTGGLIISGLLSAIRGIGSIFTSMGQRDCGAAIGSGDSRSAGTINIKNSIVVARSGKMAAGIGCGKATKVDVLDSITGVDTRMGGAYRDINIEGSIVEAKGGDFAAGIGGGEKAGAVKNTKIRIFESLVEATGGKEGAGIGSGNEYPKYGTIEIDSAIVKAYGGAYGAGIGGGDGGGDGSITIKNQSDVKAYAGEDAAAIGGGEGGNGGSIEIEDSTVYAQGNYYGAGIGGGEDEGVKTVTIRGSNVTAIGGDSGNTRGIGHGAYSAFVSFFTGYYPSNGILYFPESSFVRIGEDEDDTRVVTASYIYENGRGDETRYINIYPCPHDNTELCVLNSLDHVWKCTHCRGYARTEAHNWNSDHICTVCGAHAEMVTLTLKEQDDNGEVTRTVSIPRFTAYEFAAPEHIPDGQVFVCWIESYTDPKYSGDTASIDGNVTYTALYAPAVETTYIDENGYQQTVTARKFPVTNDSLNLYKGWYIIDEDIPYDIGSYVTLYGDVKLILKDDVTVSSIYLHFNNSKLMHTSLALYGQAKQTGTIHPSNSQTLGQFQDFVQYGGRIINSEGLKAENCTIAGGVFEASSLEVSNKIELGWSRWSDYIHVNNYSYNNTNPEISVMEGKKLMIGSSNTVLNAGVLTDNQKRNIRNQTLIPNVDFKFNPTPVWKWSADHTEATATFSNTAGVKAEVRANVEHSIDGLYMVSTATVNFMGTLYSDTEQTQFRWYVINQTNSTSGHGAVAFSADMAEPGELVEITATPDPGFCVSAVTVTPSVNNTEVEVLGNGNAFIMPQCNATVEVVFEQEAPNPITISKTGNGTVTANVDKALEDDEITLNISPEEDHQLGSISAAYPDDADAERVNLTVLSGDGEGDQGYAKLLDGKTSTKWCIGVTEPRHITMKADAPVFMSGYSLTTGNDNASYKGRNWKDYTIYGANFASDSEATRDSAQWQVVKAVENDSVTQDVNNTTFDYSLDTPAAAYQYYKIEITSNKGGSSIQMSKFEMKAAALHEITLSGEGNTRTFTMPVYPVLVTAEFVPSTTRVITWQNEDGSVIDTQDVELGTVPSHDAPEKAEDLCYTYSFVGWNDGESTYAPDELPAVTKRTTYTAVFETVRKPYFSSHSLSLNGDIGVNFYLNLTDQEITDKAVVDFVWTVDGKEKTHSVTLTAADKTSCGYKASCPIAVAEMTYDITAALKIGGVRQDETDTYSAQRYAQVILTNEKFRDYFTELKGQAKYDQLVTLVKAMLDYGSKAQIRFNRNTDRLANGGTDYFTDEVNIPNGANDMSEYLGDCGLEYVGTSVVYLSETTLRHYYRIVEPDLFTNEIKNGITFDGEAVTCGVKNGMIYFDKKDIAASQLDTEYVIRINGHEYPYSALDYSALSYGSDDKQYSDSITKQLAAAVYRYNQAANAYFAD